jgi:hypothetical protein
MVEEEALRACGAESAQLLMLSPDGQHFWSPHQGMHARFHVKDVRASRRLLTRLGCVSLFNPHTRQLNRQLFSG